MKKKAIILGILIVGLVILFLMTHKKIWIFLVATIFCTGLFLLLFGNKEKK